MPELGSGIDVFCRRRPQHLRCEVSAQMLRAALGRFDLRQLPRAEMMLVISPGDRPAIGVKADLRGCDAMDIRMTIDGDGVSRMDTEHCGASHGIETMADMGDMSGSWMDGMMGSGGMAGHGSATMHEDDEGHMGLAVELPGFDPGASIEMVLVSPAGELVSLGVYTTGSDGVIRASWDASSGEPLPFDAHHMHDLSGMVLEARDELTSGLLFSSMLPVVTRMTGGC